MKIHEYNEMMAYLTRPSYVSGGRVGFKRGSGNPVAINASTLAKFDDLIKNTNLTLKEIGRKFGYAADLRSNSYLVKAYEDAFGKIPEARFKPYTMVGTEKAKQILSLYDQQLATLPEANFSAIAREVLGKDDRDSRRVIQSLVERERGLTRAPNPKYEGPLSEGQRASLARRTKLKKVTDLELEKLIRAREGSGLNLHHMESKRWNVTMGNLAYVDASLNQNVLMDGDAQLEKWYKQRDKLADDAIEAHKAINEKGKNFVKQKKFKGLLNFKTYDPATKKLSDVGMDLSKAIIPEGQLEELRNVPLKELTKDQKAKVVEVAQKVRDGLAKGEPGILKKGLGMLGKGLGKIVAGAFGPTGIALLEARHIGGQLESRSAKDVALDPISYSGIPFMGAAAKNIQQTISNPYMQRLLSLGINPQTVARVAGFTTPLSLAAIGGTTMYQIHKTAKEIAENPELLERARQSNLQMEAAMTEESRPDETMFNQGGSVGSPTGMITEYGRKVYETPGGEKVSEKSVTLKIGDAWINVPSIHGGKMYNQAQLEQMLISGEIQPTSTHNSQEEAERAAALRSDTMQSERIGFAKGPKDPSKRLFLKGVGALSLVPILGKYFKLAAPATKAAAAYTGPVLEGLGNKLKWVQLLAKRLWNEGDDVTETASTMDGQVVRRGTLESGDEVDMFYDTRKGDVSFQVNPKKTETGYGYETKSGAYNKEYGIEYKAPEVIEETGKKTKSDVSVAEIEGRMTPDDVDWDLRESSVDDAMSDLTELEAFAKKKTVKQIHKKKGTKPKDVFPDYDPPEPYDFEID